MLKKIFKQRETPLTAGFETAVFTFAGQVLGLAKNVVIAALFGASAETDVFFAANTLIATPTGLLSDAMNALIIPKFQKEQRKEYLLRSVSASMFLIFLVVLLAFLMFGHQLAGIVFKGFNQQKLELLTKIIWVLMPLAVLAPFVGFFDSVLRSQKFLIFGNFGGLLGSIASLVALILVFKLRVYGLAISAIAGTTMSFLFLIIAVSRRYKFQGEFSFKYGFVQLKDSLPLMVGGSFGIISAFFDKFFASFLSDGTITLLNMSLSLTTVVRTLFISTLISAFFPFISESIVSNDVETFDRYLQQIKKLTYGIFGLLSVTLIPMSYPVLKIIYGHGKFNLQAVQGMTSLFIIFTSLFITSAITNMLVQIFYSVGETKLVTINSISWLVVGILLNFLIVKHLGVKGLALTTAVVSVVNTTVLALFLHRRIGKTLLELKDLLVMAAVSLIDVIYGFQGWNIASFLIPVIYYLFVTRFLYRVDLKAYVLETVKRIRSRRARVN